MRIGLITGEYPPMQGGVGDFTRELATALGELGHTPRVFTRYLPDAPQHETLGHIHVHRLVTRWGWDTRKRAEAFARVHPVDVFNLQYQAAAFQMHPAINLLPAGLSAHIPTVVTFHDLRVPYLFPKAGQLRWKAIVGMAKAASACIVTNDEDHDILRREGVTRVHLVPIGSNVAPQPLAQFDRSAWLREHNIDPALTLIGYFGFMNESKGGDTLMRALATLRARGINAGVLHIGGQTGDSDPTNAAYAAQLRALGAENGAGPYWFETGFLDDDGVSSGFASCAAVALPYRDGASYRRGTLMAALAHSQAIVTTAPRIHIPLFEHNRNVVLTPADAPDHLADALARVCADPELQTRLQHGAAELSRHFAWDRIAAHTAAIFAEAARHDRQLGTHP